MTDLANISITVDTSSVAAGAGDLNALVAAAASMETAAADMSTAVSALTDQLAAMRGQVTSATGETASLWEKFSSGVKEIDGVLDTLKTAAELPKKLKEVAGAGQEVGDALKTFGKAGRGAGAWIAAFVTALMVADEARRDYVEGQEALEGAFDRLSYASSTTAEDLQHLAEVAAESANISIASAREMEVAYINMGVTNTDVMAKLIGSTVEYAQVTGIDAKQATDELGLALSGSTMALEIVDGRLNFLDDSTKQYLIKLRNQNDMTEYQKTLLENLSKYLGTAEKKVNDLGDAWANAKIKAADYWEKAGNFIQRFVAPDPVAKARRYGMGRNPIIEEDDAKQVRRRQERENSQRREQQKVDNEYIRSFLPVEREISESEASLVRLQKIKTSNREDELARLRAILEVERRLKRLRGQDSSPSPPRVSAARATITATASLSGKGCDCDGTKKAGCEEIESTCAGAQAALNRTAAGAKGVAQELLPVAEAVSAVGEAVVAQAAPALENIIQTGVDVSATLGEMVPPTLTEQLKELGATAANVGTLATAAFGEAGKPLVNFTAGVTAMTDAYVAYADKIKEINASNASDEAKRQKSQYAAIDTYAKMAGAAKGFFKEGSSGYKAMEAAEKAFRTVQLAMQIRSMAMQAKEVAARLLGITTTTTAETAATTTSIGNSLLKAGASVMAGAAKMFEQGGIVGFALVAAMLAVMASLGFSGGGGGSAPAFDLKKKQDAQGTGSTLGAPAEKSDSLTKSLTDATEAQKQMAGYQNSMVGYLRSIDAKIGAFATNLVKQISGGGLLSTKELGLGTSGQKARLLNLGFGSQTTRTLQDQGLTFGSSTVGDIAQNGLSGSTYQDVLVNKKKTGFFITFSDKTSLERTTSALPDDFSDQGQAIIAGLRDSIVEAAGVLGLEGAEATIDAFTVALGDISLNDMTGEAIEATLNAVFGKLADDMAAFVAGDLLDQYQRIGEGQFETLIRLANGVQLVTAQLASVGLAFNHVGVAAVQASQAMINAAGGMEAFASGMEFFRNNFLTESERMGPVIERVTLALSELGLAGVTTIEQFKAAMLTALEAGDATRVAGLMAIQEDFLDMAKYTEKLAEAQAQAAASAASAASAVSTASNAVQDLTKQLQDFYRSLVSGPLAQLSPEAAYTAAREEFERVSGDPAQKDKLVQASQAFLDASKGFNASSLGYFRDLEQVKLAVEAAGGLPAGFSPTTPGSWLSNAKVTADVGALQAPLDDLRGDVVAQLRALITQNAAIRAEERADNEALLEQVRTLVRATRAS